MVTKLLQSIGDIVVEYYTGSEDAAVTVTTTTLTDTRGFTPSGASNYWAGATVYSGTTSFLISASTATVLTTATSWTTGPPADGQSYVIVRDKGSQYRYANQVYTAQTSDATETALWVMPTLSLPDSTNIGAGVFIKADVTAIGTSVGFAPAIAKWQQEAVFTWSRSNSNVNEAARADVNIIHTQKVRPLRDADVSLRLRASDLYPALLVTGLAATSIFWQATIEFSVYSIS